MLTYQRISIAIFLAFLCTATVALAETRYIADQLVVSLRQLPQNNSETIVYLRTDTPVEVLEVGEEYLKVKTTNGEVGYIQKSYLTEKTPKATIISRLTRENEGLKGRVEELEKQYREVFSKGDEAQKKILSELENSRSKIAKLEKDLNKSETELAERSQAYESLRKNAENIIDITAERDQLRLSHEELTAAVNKLEEQRKELLKKETIQWFLTGAGVLFLGWLIGKFSRSRRKGSLY
jgi:SH3 domain protein